MRVTQKLILSGFLVAALLAPISFAMNNPLSVPLDDMHVRYTNLQPERESALWDDGITLMHQSAAPEAE
jgi:hypothetical protein